jgi:hypothetical protein
VKATVAAAAAAVVAAGAEWGVLPAPKREES